MRRVTVRFLLLMAVFLALTLGMAVIQQKAGWIPKRQPVRLVDGMVVSAKWHFPYRTGVAVDDTLIYLCVAGAHLATDEGTQSFGPGWLRVERLGEALAIPRNGQWIDDPDCRIQSLPLADGQKVQIWLEPGTGREAPSKETAG